MMNDDQPVGGIYVYRGGQAPDNITHAIIDKSVKVIDEEAFENNKNLLSVDTHDGIDSISRAAFGGCVSLAHLDIRSVRILHSYAFADSGLTEVDCDNLEIIEDRVFSCCRSLRRITFPKVRRIGACAFEEAALTEVLFSETLERVSINAFYANGPLRRICLPLDAEILFRDKSACLRYDPHIFGDCDNFSTVELIGGIHETVSSLHMESWGNDMRKDITRINRTLPSIPSNQKTNVIRWWLQSVHSRIEHYKTEHIKVLKEATVLLELALWKAKLDDDNEGGNDSLEAPTKKVKVDVGRARDERRVTSGANIVIKNVLPFLKLK